VRRGFGDFVVINLAALYLDCLSHWSARFWT